MDKMTHQEVEQVIVQNLDKLASMISEFISKRDHSLITSIRNLSAKVHSDLDGIRSIVPNKKWLNLHSSCNYVTENLTINTKDIHLVNIANTCINVKNYITHKNVNTQDDKFRLLSARQLTLAYSRNKHLMQIISNYKASIKDKLEIQLCSNMMEDYAAKLASIELSLLNLLFTHPDIKIEFVKFDPTLAKIDVDVLKVIKHFNRKGEYNA